MLKLVRTRDKTRIAKRMSSVKNRRYADLLKTEARPDAAISFPWEPGATMAL
jgi:hypothetical protein